MNDKIQLHEECLDFGYIWDFKAGRFDESQPICYNSAVKSRHPDKIVHLCTYGRAVKLGAGDCATCCEFFPKQHKQDSLLS